MITILLKSQMQDHLFRIVLPIVPLVVQDKIVNLNNFLRKMPSLIKAYCRLNPINFGYKRRGRYTSTITTT